jgi:TonB family protein
LEVFFCLLIIEFATPSVAPSLTYLSISAKETMTRNNISPVDMERRLRRGPSLLPPRQSSIRRDGIPSFRYELGPSPYNERIAWSAVLHALALLAIVKFAAWFPAPKMVRNTNAVAITPIYMPKVQQPPVIAPKIETPATKVQAKLVPPKIETPPAPTRVPEREMPAPQPRPEVVPETPIPVPPVKIEPRKKEIVTDTFTATGANPKPATENKPARAVQTGGFGDSNGVAGASAEKRALTVASVGSFDLPSGPGKGNGSGGAHGSQATVSSSGFGNGVAGPGNANRPQGTVAAAGFSTMTAATPAARPQNAPTATPVEILYKPRPAYTAEARQMRIQGEVLVEVMFRASGDLQINRITSGLGHGLDESALRAAQLIKFRPAMRDGRPCDSNAIVHIIFELAE